jgi:4'-phosphopantetheinyl transferase
VASASSFPGSGAIVAWHAHIDRFSAAPETCARARRLLLPHEHERLDRYRSDDDRMMFLLGRTMARAMVGRAIGVAPEAWRWREGAHGRPEVDDPRCPIRFNVAHSAGLVVCAIASGRDVGVDVEDVRRSPPNPLVVTRYCSPMEAADIGPRGDPGWQARFLQYWTLKEAYLKARGLGISVPLAEIEFRLNGTHPRVGFRGSLAESETGWSFHLGEIPPRYLVAIAAESPVGPEPRFVIEPMPGGP